MSKTVCIEQYELEIEITSCVSVAPNHNCRDSDCDYYGYRDMEFEVVSGVEYDEDEEFVAYLRQKFPAVTIHQLPAQEAARLVPAGVSTVISGLPLLSMPEDVRQGIVSAAFAILAPRGRYVQFTYGPRPPLPPETIAALGLTVNKGHKVWANLPPATVYRFRRA